MPFCRAIMMRPSQQKVFLPGSFSHFRTTFFLATITDMAGPSMGPPLGRALPLLCPRHPRARLGRAGLGRALRGEGGSAREGGRRHGNVLLPPPPLFQGVAMATRGWVCAGGDRARPRKAPGPPSAAPAPRE